MVEQLISTIRLVDSEQNHIIRKMLIEAVKEKFNEWLGVSPASILKADEIEAGVDIGKIRCISMYRSRTWKSLWESNEDVMKEFERLGLKFKEH
jgi:hypothetical protein